MDGGGEFVNKSFKNHCTELGINHTISPPDTPQHNTFSERVNRSILKKARCLLLQSSLPLKFWTEAVSTATFLYYQNVQSAFLNTPFQEEICLEIPQGVSANKETQVLQLKKALYGLKQASLAWYKKFSKSLILSGFQCSLTDPCVFWNKGKNSIWIYFHVDDLAIFGPDLEDFKREIKSKFEMKDLGKANFLLGIKINHLNDGFSIDQEHYIDKLAEKYKIKDFVPSNTPLKPHLQLTNLSEKEHKDFNILNINYQSAIGSLSYISSNTRPDITFSISHLSQFLERPGMHASKFFVI
ncbi:hypothetical protein O181_007008 [Austropuccinia psidii MF-1]|uniref:Integrase catalytic domain-containing protein n=1 Tax=Austropuccinia psidii MF-1 TaxID=1389203 RepID=A0A9Q3BLK2_9BASI|nr:hypothetical protein [Austropuccinia psidii MF-1]